MEKRKTILVIILIISILLNIYLFTKANMLSYEKGKSQQINEQVLALFKSISQPCSSQAFEQDKILNCLTNLNKKFETPPVEEKDFKNMDRRTNESGYLIILNKGMKSLESAGFTLWKNHVQVDAGCVIPGNITRQETCKLFFDTYCEKGDVLDVQYAGETLWKRIC
ncbi:MAG: hypothetical protein V1743_00710 [Nanoarchaeota archaeon]